MKLTINGYKITIKTKVDGSNRLTAKAIVSDLDSMVIRVSGPTISGILSQEEKDSIVRRVVVKVINEFHYMARMAIGHQEEVS